MLVFQGEINLWEGVDYMDIWQINLGKLSPF